MRSVYATLALALVSSIHALPFEKRINQIIADSLADWETACDNAGGGQQCNALKVQAFGTLLAGADVCGQQNFADQMIDLAKTVPNDNTEMIRLTKIFRQQPRNAPDSLSVLYCQDTPKNEELVGYFQCQFQGVNDNVFTGNVAAGQPGTLPPGVSSLPAPGACPANLGGKIPDGVQLVTLVSDPGNPFTGGNNNGNNNGNTGGNQSPVQAAPPVDTPSTADKATSSAEAAPPAATSPASNPGGFQLANAQQAQQQNRDFANLTADSACQDGQIACIGDAFAQCANGKFAVTSCAASTRCAALPLVNSAGTSVTCDTDADIAARFAAAGANGGIDGQQ